MHSVPFGAFRRAVSREAAARVPLLKEGALSFLLRVGSGTLSAVSALETRASSVLHPLFACHGGVMARCPA